MRIDLSGKVCAGTAAAPASSATAVHDPISKRETGMIAFSRVDSRSQFIVVAHYSIVCALSRAADA